MDTNGNPYGGGAGGSSSSEPGVQAGTPGVGGDPLLVITFEPSGGGTLDVSTAAVM
jgi:hypothetical protein